MLENHRTGAGYFAGDSEALYEPQYHEKHWSEARRSADMSAESPTAIVEKPHEEHAHDQHRLSTMRCRPNVQEQRLQWARAT